MAEKKKKGIGNRVAIAIVIVALVAVAVFVPISEEGTLVDILSTSRPNVPPPACIEIFAPVCGVNGETFPNACFANVENVQIAHNGECTEDEGIIMTEDPSTFCKIYPTASGC